MQETAAMLSSLGLVLPTPAYLFGVVLFSFIGIGVFAYGRKRQRPPVKWLGLALMLYPYVTPATWALYLVGGALCAAVLFALRR
jgi:hypothetical protein